MKLPKIAMPKWYRRWHLWQAITIAFLIMNVVMALFMPAFTLPAVNWFAAGVMTAQLFSNHIIWGVIDSNRSLLRIVNEMGQLQTDEIAREIAAEMHTRMTGNPDAPPLAPTKH